MQSIIPDRSVIKISGIDSTKFLQNLVTNDVSSCVDTIYAMMLSPQGRFLFDMFIIKQESGYLLDIFTGTKDFLLKKLRMYKINMQVEIEEMENLSVGYESSDVIPEPSIVIPAKAGIQPTYKDPRYNMMGYRMILDSRSQDDGKSYIQDKYKYAIPDGGIDLLYDKAMPQEYGAEQLRAISYIKGCYAGQEVISRTKSQGVVRKKIYKITADFDLSTISHGTEITIDNVKIGIFCSGYIQEGIALIREADAGGFSKDTSCIIDGRAIIINVAGWYNPELL